MLVFPNAKINFGLNILRKRPDGYHDLETCFHPVPWADVLEIVESEVFSISTSGIDIPDDGPNIIEKAYQSLSEDHDLPPVDIHLHKVVPIGAGLGGGSADAAFALRLLNEKFNLSLSDEQLIKYAIPIGADCAFFIKNKPMLASGIGEKLIEVELSLEGKKILMVYPGIHISTKEAYSNINPGKPEISIAEILKNHSIADWKDLLKNDFEESIFSAYPVLESIKEQLYQDGAEYAAMSGSGSCMFGIFNEKPKNTFPEKYNVFIGTL